MVDEAETAALRTFLSEHAGDRMVSSALVRTELRRAALRYRERAALARELGQEIAQSTTALLRRLDLVRVGPAVLDRAGDLRPISLRSLDAIHLVTALTLGPDLSVLVAYDHRLLAAARDAGLPVASPGTANPDDPEQAVDVLDEGGAS